MDKQYTAPTIESLGSLKELTATPNSGNNNGCKQLPGNGKNKAFTHTDGFNNGQTGCLS